MFSRGLVKRILTKRAGPRAHDAASVAGSDLFVCILGSSYGSVDPDRGTSYTEMEFDAAVNHHLPCLIYIKKGEITSEDPRQIRFKARLKSPERIVHTFATLDQLRERFAAAAACAGQRA